MRPAGEVRPREIIKHSTVTESFLTVSSGGAGPSWSRASGSSAAAAAAVKSAGKARPSRIVKYSVTSESEPGFAESSDEEPRVNEGNSGLPSGCGMRRNVSCEPKKLFGLPERPPCHSKVRLSLSPWTGCDKKKKKNLVSSF